MKLSNISSVRRKIFIFLIVIFLGTVFIGLMNFKFVAFSFGLFLLAVMLIFPVIVGYFKCFEYEDYDEVITIKNYFFLIGNKNKLTEFSKYKLLYFKMYGIHYPKLKILQIRLRSQSKTKTDLYFVINGLNKQDISMLKNALRNIQNNYRYS